MPEKLQQAIVSIKSGDKQLGQQLLAQVLQEEPGNEQAWLWMSAVVSEDKRQYCIERVLKINPNNQQALMAMEKLKQAEDKQKSVAMPDSKNSMPSSQIIQPVPPPPLKQNLQKPESISGVSPSASAPQFWINPTRKGSHVIVLHENKLLTAKCEARFTTQVAAKLAQGDIPTEVLTEKVTISYSSLIKIEETSTSLRFDFSNQSNRKESIWMESKDKEMLNAILVALEARLGTDFERTTAPMSRGSILMGNGILMVIILAVSTFFYFAALDIDSGGTSPTGSARTRGIIILLDWIGPGGVACIGGGLFLLVLISMVMSLAKPPLVTTLLRKNANAVSKEPEKPDYQRAEPIKNSEPSPAKMVQSSSEQNEMDAPPSLLGAALSDGLMAGLAGGVLGAIMPIIFILTNDSSFFVFALLCNGAAIFAVGIFTGILFYKRKLPRGTKAVGVGGGLGGAIAGGIGGLLIGYSMSSAFSEAGTDITQGNVLFSFLLLFCCAPAVVSSIIGAITAWIPGLFIKPAPQR